MDIELSKVKVRLPGASRDLFRIPSLKIESGEKVLVQAPSGKGKTTLLHLIAGLFVPDEGKVTVGGEDLSQMNETTRAHFRREKMGLIFQRLNLLEHLTAEENVRLGSPHGSREQAHEALAKVGLKGREEARSSVLSLGEQQRVAVARVLMARPKVLLADEPTSSLDQANADRVLELLFEASKDQTLVLVSHDQRIASRFERRFDFEEWVRT